jgi:hypothetical protein
MPEIPAPSAASVPVAPVPVAPVPAVAPAAPVAAAAPLDAPFDALSELFPVSASSVLLAEPEQAADPLAPAAVVGVQPEPATSWPCLACGELVPLEAPLCGHCGASFLPTASMPTLKLPGLGVISNLEGGAKAMVIVGGALVITVLFFIAAFVLGSLV